MLVHIKVIIMSQFNCKVLYRVSKVFAESRVPLQVRVCRVPVQVRVCRASMQVRVCCELAHHYAKLFVNKKQHKRYFSSYFVAKLNIYVHHVLVIPVHRRTKPPKMSNK